MEIGPWAFKICKSKFKIVSIQNKPSTDCQSILNIFKVAKFRQIWSHHIVCVHEIVLGGGWRCCGLNFIVLLFQTFFSPTTISICVCFVRANFDFSPQTFLKMIEIKKVSTTSVTR